MNDPKFNVGDRLYWRQDLEHWRETVWPVLKKSETKGYVSMGELGLATSKPVHLQVVEVLTQRCYGGLQIHYVFRKADSTTFQLTEAELTNEPLVPTEPA